MLDAVKFRYQVYQGDGGNSAATASRLISRRQRSLDDAASASASASALPTGASSSSITLTLAADPIICNQILETLNTSGVAHVDSVSSVETLRRNSSDIITREDNYDRRRAHEELRASGFQASHAPISPGVEVTSVENKLPFEGTEVKERRGGLSAKEHFKKKGSMSPLQRCSDILCMVWPLVLMLTVNGDAARNAIVATSTIDEGTGRRSHTSSSTLESFPPTAILDALATSTSPVCVRTYEVTDGWWWTRAILAPELDRLVEKVEQKCVNRNVAAFNRFLCVRHHTDYYSVAHIIVA